MKKLGYILCKEELPKDHSFIENVQITDRFDDQGLPKLIIGWQLVQQHYRDHSILNPRISERTWWTFSAVEDRQVFRKDFYEFLDMLPDRYFSCFRYRPIELVQQSKEQWLTPLQGSAEGVIAYHHQPSYHLYCFLPAQKEVVGYDLKMLRYLNVDVSAFITYVKERFTTQFYVDDEHEQHLQYIASKIGSHSLLKRFLVTLFP